MELAIKKQMVSVGYIQRFWENLIKVGKERLTRAYLTARLELLESYWTRFLSAHDELLSFDEIDNSCYMEDDVYTKAEDSYVEMKTRLSAYMLTVKETVRAVEGSSSVKNYMQLPTQDLPTFDGDQLAWACLKGEAAEVVDNIEMSADGYALAWEELGQRYDADLQRILWRLDPAAGVQDFRLTTVTYGTAPAPYLAIRTLLQLAQDEGARYPLGSDALRLNTYVDDILAGASSLEDAMEVRRQLTELLSKGGFQLSRWTGTHAALCPDGDGLDRLFSGVDGVSTLGVLWSPNRDLLSLRAVPALSSIQTCTKRTILSDVARFFDPIGWAAPVLIVAKILLQDLWMAGLAWDEPLPEVSRARWMTYVGTLPGLSQLAGPRWLGVTAESSIELHGFADASTRAYAAAIYVRGTGMSGATVTRLLVAKTKVAPVKPVSIPRLELCGALLVARLLQRVATDLGCSPNSLHAWTDAKVVLAWIKAHPSRWKPFVANRVASIQEIVPAGRWRFVPTKENPADAATRGLTPEELARHSLWWTGPHRLKPHAESWPDEALSVPDILEEVRIVATTGICSRGDNELLTRFSSLSRLIRISAYCLRFKRGRIKSDFLTTDELNHSLLRWLRIVQRQDFSSELKALEKGEPLPRKSAVLALCPFLGADGLIRVGGLLRNSSLRYGERHPVILSKDSYLSQLLVRDAHSRTLHGGIQLTRSVLARHYWIVHANCLIRAVIHRCVQCVRFRGQTLTQQMGQLPRDRVQAARPFKATEVDFAGPVFLRSSSGLGHKSYKGYICLFVCMATKAIHLEAVSGLTSALFIAAFKRFVSRRGAYTRLYSDNGTNFRGANRELQDMFLAAADTFKQCRAELAADGTEWSFTPPSAPHFGGLWEAGVKSTKHHFRRVIGDHKLTYEELSTLLCMIEACLNSRPLHEMSSVATDLVALTPGHFLIGEAPINIPEPSTLTDPPKSLSLRWRLISHMRDQFWDRWSKEYLHHLQQTRKWKRSGDNLRTGALVLIKDELQPPSKWALARVRKTHPGADGLVRVVTVDTASSTLTRPITKICPLPVSD